MTKLAKYLKPYIGSILLAFILLFVQAMSDLNLPNFMSDIVNVGIQQNGIEHAAPDAISEQGYDFITSFMTDEQKKTVSEAYEEVTPSAATDKQIKKYPEMKNERAYVLRNTDEDTYTKLDAIFGEADWTFINFVEDMAEQKGSTASQEDMTANVDDMDLSKLYEMTPMLKMMPKEQFDSAREKAVQTPESTQQQTGAIFVREFYKELGADTSYIQTMYILKIGGIMLGLSLIGVIAAICVGLLAAKVAAGFSQVVRRDIFKKVESFSNTEFNRFSTASLI
ncbi:MAG: ABC transporter ATP-binding protein, partial [Eubacterium callanderi]